MKLRYLKSADNWNEALPIGNGHLGGMIYGRPVHELISLNDEHLWYRGKVDRNNPDSAKQLPKIRELLMSGKVHEAEELIRLAMFATPRDQSHYETMGELFIDMLNLDDTKINDYSRQLDLETAVHTVRFRAANNEYSSQTFASFKRNALYTQITANGGTLDLNITLGRQKRFSDGISKYHNQGIIMTSRTGGSNGVRFKTGCIVSKTDGAVSVIGETIVVRKATYVQLALTAATDYATADGQNAIFGKLDSLQTVDFADELLASESCYQDQFKRVALDLGTDDDCGDTASMLTEARNGQRSPQLVQTLFDYGRYLLISASQPGGLPANLQGLWTDQMNPIWGSKYTININTEMNYWLVGPCDLPEVELPLFDMLEHMREPGRVTARKMYGARGFTAHHNTDGFFDTAPQSKAIGAAVWPLTVPWLLTHIWEYYNYFGDVEVVEKHYDMFKEAFAFYKDYLFEYKGYLVTGPSASPENQYFLPDGTAANVTIAPTIDGEILRLFCEACLDFAELMHDDSDFADDVRAVREKLPPIKIGKHGQVQEWLEDYDEVEVGHRHISPLFGLHPGHEIDVDKTPELAAAANVTIKRRLSGGKYLDQSKRDQAVNDWLSTGLFSGTRTGWSLAWLVHFFARLREGNQAYDELQGMIQHSLLPNLFCDHPPFQIDGNYGFVSGLCEMLLQSQGDEIIVLPALPDELASGSFNGLRARGGAKISAKWTDHVLRKVLVHGRAGSEVAIRVLADVSVSGREEHLEIQLDEEGNGVIKW
ncbi:glycoside hydrolase family 95 protein [Lacticaseibacillus zhaodongensis]|uniref:glycoside hydrolase family 95 protein n=1 Tax=Lacticaseibacillus zhaodongensis TaxID=2668065 RepID=UPI0012D34733|nr:glycoside hydrolase family 95 protein [Lacticaseibacillus zhaodongensis]